MQAKVLANLASSALTIASTFLPWIRYNTGYTLSAVQAQDAWMAISLVVAGGIISLLSRYGGLLTMTGVWIFVASPPSLHLFVAEGVVITSSFETGVWLAWAGATISLLGSAWTPRFGLPKTEENWKEFGMILFQVAVVSIVFGFIIPLPGSIILIFSGLIVLGVCIVLLLSVRDRTLFQILKGLVGGDKHEKRKSDQIGK
jgi:hypothetical protein